MIDCFRFNQTWQDIFFVSFVILCFLLIKQIRKYEISYLKRLYCFLKRYVVYKKNHTENFSHKDIYAITNGMPYDLSKAKDRIILVFYMGLGDFIYTTPLIKKIKESYPEKPIDIFVPEEKNSTSSPFLDQIASIYPEIRNIYKYRGGQTFNWKLYNISDALRQIGEDEIAFRVNYKHNESSLHRVHDLFEQFGFPLEFPASRPYIPVDRIDSTEITKIISNINKNKKIVFCHLDTRSNNFYYPKINELYKLLIRQGYYIISATPCDLVDENLYVIDMKILDITKVIKLIFELNKKFNKNFSMLTASSVFWSVSSAFNILNLGIHTFHDRNIREYYYSNIYILTKNLYKEIPYDKIILIEESGTLNTSSIDHSIIKPEKIIDYFNHILLLSNN